MVGRDGSIARCAIASVDGDKGEIGAGQTRIVVGMDNNRAVSKKRRGSALG